MLRQAAVKLILQRHWLEAEIMPYVLRYLGVATVLDPGPRAGCHYRSYRALLAEWGLREPNY